MSRIVVAFRAFVAALFNREKAEQMQALLESKTLPKIDGAAKPQPPEPRLAPSPPARSEAVTLLAALQREYQENDLFPATDITEDWLKLTDFDPDNVIKLGPIRPSKPDTVGNAIV